MARPNNLKDLQRAAGGLAPENPTAPAAGNKKGTTNYSRNRFNLPKKHAWVRRQFPWRPMFITIAVIFFLLVSGSAYLVMSGQKFVTFNFVSSTGSTYYLAFDGGITFISRRIPQEGIETDVPWWKFESRWYKQNPDTHWEFPGVEWHVEQVLRDVAHISADEIYAMPVEWRGKIHPWLFMSLTALAGILAVTRPGKRAGKLKA